MFSTESRKTIHVGWREKKSVIALVLWGQFRAKGWIWGSLVKSSLLVLPSTISCCWSCSHQSKLLLPQSWSPPICSGRAAPHLLSGMHGGSNLAAMQLWDNPLLGQKLLNQTLPSTVIWSGLTLLVQVCSKTWWNTCALAGFAVLRCSLPLCSQQTAKQQVRSEAGTCSLLRCWKLRNWVQTL